MKKFSLSDISSVKIIRLLSSIILVFLIIAISYCSNSCSNKSDNPHEEEIREFVSENEYTVFFAWASWCVGCKNTLKNYVLPYMENSLDNVGLVLMYYGNKDDLTEIYEYQDDKTKIYVMESFRGLDKRSINNQFKDLFKDYKSVNYVPVTIVCNRDFKILNFSKEPKDSEYFTEYMYFPSSIGELKKNLSGANDNSSK